MEFITDLITPSELTGSVQAASLGGMPFAAVPPPIGTDVSGPPSFGNTAFGLPNLFPIQETDDIRYELENSDISGVDEVAHYRSWDTVPQIGKRPGIQLIGGEIVPLSRSYRLNEEDLQRYARLIQAIGERSDNRVLTTITGDAIRAAAAVQNRITLGHAEILTTGTMTLTELGNVVGGNALTAVFPVPDAHTTTAGVLWSDHANAVAIENFKAWEETYADNNNGATPDEWWITTDAAGDLLQHTKLLAKAVWAVGTSNAPSIPNIDVVGQILNVHGVQSPLRVVNVRRPPLAGGAKGPVLGTRKVIGVRAGMGRTLFTPPVSAAMMPADARIEAQYQAGIIAYAQSSIRPPEVLTTSEAVAVPVLSNPNALFVANV